MNNLNELLGEMACLDKDVSVSLGSIDEMSARLVDWERSKAYFNVVTAENIGKVPCIAAAVEKSQLLTKYFSEKKKDLTRISRLTWNS